MTPVAHADYAGPPPVLLAVAQCESGQRQFNKDGSLVIGPTKDIGYFQISPKWEEKAKGMGWDIRTESGNVAMGVWLYNQYGLQPWNSSKKCWSKYES